MVYRGMDIRTAKPGQAELARHPHHLIDIRDHAERYSVAEFLVDARRVVEAALGAGRVPLLVGGTKLYLKAFKSGVAALPAASEAVRARHVRRAEREGSGAATNCGASIQRLPASTRTIRSGCSRAPSLRRAADVPSAWWSEQSGRGIA
jgi:tRNA dimethylallyltransferase